MDDPCPICGLQEEHDDVNFLQKFLDNFYVVETAHGVTSDAEAWEVDAVACRADYASFASWLEETYNVEVEPAMVEVHMSGGHLEWEDFFEFKLKDDPREGSNAEK